MNMVVVGNVKGMKIWPKIALITLLTFFLSVFMYQGLLKPLIIDSATNTYFFTLDSSSQNLGADGSTSTSVHGHDDDHHHYDDTKISMTAGTYNSLKYIDARSNNNWQPMLDVYGPAYSNPQTLTSPRITIGVRDRNGTSNPIYWKADVYDYNPAGSKGNGILLWTSSGTDESHAYTVSPLTLSFGNEAGKSIPTGHRLKVKITCRQTSTNSQARLYWGGSTGYSYLAVTETAAVANTVIVTNLADYSSGGLKSVAPGEQNVAMLKFDLYANTATNWSGGKLDKVGSNQNLGDLVYSIFKDSNGNGSFDPESDTQIGGPYSFTQATGSTYTLTPQALSAVPQRYFITYSISVNATPATTVGVRIVDNSYFTISNGSVTNVSSTSSSLQTINAGGSAITKIYAADWDTGTPLIRPEAGGETNTDSICISTSVTEGAGTSLVGLLNFPAHTCTSKATGTYHFSSAANDKFVTLYFNDSSGYSSERAQVKGISFKFRARSNSSNGMFTLRLFYVKPDGTRVNSPIASTFTTSSYITATVSLAGQTFKNVPTGSRLGIQIGVSKSGCGIGLGSAVGSQLLVEETPMASTGVIIGDGAIVLGGNVLASDTENSVNSFTLSSPAGIRTITSVTISGGPMTTSTNVAAVRLYADNGVIGVHDSADTHLGSGTFVGITATISGLSEAVSGTLKNYLVIYDIAATPQTNIILTGLVTNLGGGVIIDSNSDISSGTLKILPTTTVTNGSSEPANLVVASGGASANMNAFGLKVNGGGNDTINTVTASLLPTGISTKIAKVEIVNRNTGAVYGETQAPNSADDWRISTTGLQATPAITECYIRITPKNNITTVLIVTGQVASITHAKSSNGILYEDSTSATITLDGQMPSDPVLTAMSGSSGGKIQLSWTAASDSSGLSTTKAYTLVRGATNAPAPLNCASGVLVYQGAALGITESGLSPGQAYGYRVCASDAVNNTSKGAKASAVATIPTVCNNAPTIMINPTGHYVGTGGQVEYKVSLSNNDTGACPDTSFTLSLVGTENSNNFITPSLLGMTNMVLKSNGGGAATTLTVKAKPTAATWATDTVSVKATATGHPVVQTSNIITTVSNSASMLHTSLNLGSLKYGSWGVNYSCATCHGGNATSNIKNVATKIATPNGSRPVVFQSSSAATAVTGGVFGNDLRSSTTSKNICEVCHHNTRFHQYSVAKVGMQGHNNSSDCMKCHPHGNGFKYNGGAQCDDCHGNPPTSFGTMVFPSTNALGAFAQNAGAHGKHQLHMSCAACHSNANHSANGNPSGNTLIEMGFTINGSNFPGFVSSITSGTLFSGTDNLTTGYQWAAANGTSLIKVPNFTTTCNVYCHGWPGSGGANSIPSWVGVSQKNCGTCHNASGDEPPESGSHGKHTSTAIGGNGIACKICHGTYSNYSTNVAHVNGNVEWNLSAISLTAKYMGSNSGSTGAPAPTSPASYGSCTNLYCHSNVQSNNGTAGPTRYAAPIWGSSNHCGDCHDDMALSPAPTGGHFQHVQDPQTQFDCRICHAAGGDATPQNHANGRIDFTFVGLAANTVYSKGASKAPGDGGYGSCSASDCHGRHTIVWGPATTVPLCDKCHGSVTTASFYDTRGTGSPTSKTEAFVGSHDQHIKANPYSYAMPMKCSECHLEPGGPYSPGHIDSALPAEVTFGPIGSAGIFYNFTSQPRYTAASRKCDNLWCHGGGMASNTGNGNYAGCVSEGGTLGSPVSPKWNDLLLNGNPANDCTRCHAYPPCAPGPGYVHYGLTPTSCNGCHNNVNLEGTGFIDATLHANGVVDGCFTCHGRPPVDMAGLAVPELKALSLGKPGAHNAHTLNPGINGFCMTCHNNYPSQMPSYSLQIGFNGYGGKVTSGTFYGYSSIVNNVFVSASPGTTVRRTNNLAQVNRCTNLYCHGGGTTIKPPLGGGTNTSPGWELGYDEVACGTCHGATAATYAATGSHARHAGTGTGGLGIACDRCHGINVNNYHVNGNVQWRFNSTDFSIGSAAKYRNMTSGGTGALAPSTTFGSCISIYCHSNVQGAGSVGAPTSYGTPQWGNSTTLGCDGCHKDMATDPTPTGSHLKHAIIPCDVCHNGAGSGTARHADHTIDISFSGYAAGTVYSKGSHPAGSGSGYGTCTNNVCHGNNAAVWGGTISHQITCLGCHSGAIGTRAAISSQFYANSHHIQGVNLNSAHCYQCHWEANSDGTPNANYHQKTSGAAVNLVVYGAGIRPTAYSAATYLAYSSSGSRKQIGKLNSHCLSCHNDANATTQPFGDGKTPKQYAWDGTTVAARYGDTGTTPWGKYSGTNVTPKNTRTKAYSAHGNATANQGGWSTSETWPNTRAGSMNVYCYDCHNSHGSSVSGKTTSYASATVSGGILKETTAGKGGYAMTYKPTAGGATADHNAYNPGGGLCFDCHLTATAGTKPWGYSGTFGASQKILGYMDTDFFGLGTFGYQARFPYKTLPNRGGHFGAYSTMSVSPDSSHQIGGLCTPCHDPHGVSTTLGANRQFAVPMLKGTWLTSPYKEDVATSDNQAYKGSDENPGPLPSASYNAAINSYRIDQNTFTSGTITQTEAQFAGLCLNCHPKSGLTNGTNHAWGSKDRVHESVKGWKANGTAVKHSYSCSKCHAPHNSDLPRLMVTNCLNAKHRGRMANNPSPITSGSYSSEATGSGKIPGIYSYSGEKSGSSPANLRSCHEGNDSTQKWNTKTQW